jgi:purine-binding chemotaxis protein CheW
MSGTSNSSDQALQDYLDSLLGADVPVEEKLAPMKIAATGNVATLPAPRPSRPVTARTFAEPIRTLNLRMPLPPLAEPVVVEEKVAVADAVVSPIIETPVTRAPTPDIKLQSSEPVIAPSTNTPSDEPLSLEQMAEPAPWLSNGRPHWAQQPFECLLFKAGGLMLAAPLVELGSIYPLEADNLTSVFGQSSWFIGMLPLKEYNARAIDTAMVVMPERYQESMRAAYHFLITLYGSDWGLAVDGVVNSVVLDPDNVRWRGQRSKRPWLAGTVIEQMCALLDISQLAWMFHNRDRKRHTPEPA